MKDLLFFVKIIIRWFVLCITVGPILFPNETSLGVSIIILIFFLIIAIILTIDIPSKM